MPPQPHKYYSSCLNKTTTTTIFIYSHFIHPINFPSTNLNLIQTNTHPFLVCVFNSFHFILFALMINNHSSPSSSSTQKMSFSQTCNLLSHFVKENRAFGIPTPLDASRGVEGYNRSTMNLFPVKQTEDFNGSSVGHTINLFPQISGFNSSGRKRSSSEASAAQMTIFYGGKVVVVDDLPADKADEVMKLASQLESSRLESSAKMRKVVSSASPVPVSQAMPRVDQPSGPVSVSIQTHAIPAATAMPLGSVPRADLPIARKASLHRFLEKRKDRLVGKAPSFENAYVSNPTGGDVWLGLNSISMVQQK